MHGIIYNTIMNVVIDTCVIISGLQSDMGYSYKLLDIIPSKAFDIAISVPLILEYEEKLKELLYPDIYTLADINDFVDYLCMIGKKTNIHYLWRPFLKDPCDDHVLELALASQSDYIVTFNKKDFKNLDEYGIQVVTPGEFINILKER